jgi:Squalene-hopene cyclase C-terminal domain/Prenyltransferase and squalene oxidase repeat
MNRMIDLLITDLCYLVSDLGKDGGLTSPSIYDTAQVLRLAAPDANVWDTMHWLLDQQQADGGWGNPAIPLTRDVPTLAAVLALKAHCTRRRDQIAIRAGLAFLNRQAFRWKAPLPDDIPSAVELLLPHLLEEAAAAGLALNREPYSALIALGQRRRRLITQMKPQAGTAAAHSWEAWGTTPDPAVIDGSGGVGHSPAATAAWIHKAQGKTELTSLVGAAQRYLDRASASTGTRTPGIMPNAWPIARTEQATALYGILLANMLDYSALQDAVQPILSDLAHGITATGLGTSDFFTPDGDDTAMALACLAGRRKVPTDSMLHFAIDSHFYTYIGELQPSLSATAHALHALALSGKPWPNANSYLHERQHADGRWIGDKWNGSWLYTTCHTLAALLSAEAYDPTQTLHSVLAHQHADGGWGLDSSNSEETAYAVATLFQIHRANMLPPEGHQALRRAAAFLISRYRPFAEENVAVWLAKEPYRPRRVSRAFELSATLALTVEGFVG